MYIVLEGLVGTGKSTQTQKLVERCSKQYLEKSVLSLREPGGTEIAEAIRTLVQGTKFGETMHPITDAYLYASARAQLLHSTIKPALKNGSVVLCDRSFCSSLSYQGWAQGVGLDTVWEINKKAVMDVMPDMILWMDMDVETGLSRTFDPDGDKREKLDVSFFHKAHEGYQQLFDFAPTKDLMHRIDASGSVDDVFGRIIAKVSDIAN